MGKVASIVFGLLLLLLGLIRVPEIASRIGNEGGAELLGGATFVSLEIVVGGWLVFRGVRGLVRPPRC